MLEPLPFFLIHTLSSYLLLLSTLVGMRTQLENLSKDELIDEFLSVRNDINSKFSELNDRSNDFEVKYEMVNSNLSISRCINELLLERINQLKLNKLKNAQYNKRNS